MASSRKRAPKPDPVEQRLLDALRAAVGSDDGRVDAATASRPRKPAALLIALSGGRDSVALLDAACRLRRNRAPGFAELIAIHVHHGLLAEADQWARFCEQTCARMEVALQVRRVQVVVGKRGIEEAARVARYAALAQTAREHDAAAVITAHHLDDRIETFLMQWMRGAGLDGLTGFTAARPLHEGGTALLRPWLGASRADIEHYVALRELSYVEDPSNADPKVLRSALRAKVLPALKTARPGFLRGATRSIELLAELAEAVGELAAADLAACSEDAPAGMLRLDRLSLLPPGRRALAARAWLAAQGIEMPSRARLAQVIGQALHGRADSRMKVRIGDSEVRRHRGLLLLRRVQTQHRSEVRIRWRGEPELAVPAWGGVLRFEATDGEGFEVAWLRAQPLELRGRGGGERFKPHALRPSKTLKRLFQEVGIAEFERAALPLVWREGRLIYVAGLGADARLVDVGGERIQLMWQADAELIADR
jgi:tRNA(Ile)-lysidine synthase